MRIALADDQRLFVESLSRTISARAFDIEVVGIAYDGYAIIDLVEKHRPHLVLMDVRMPRMDGVEACRLVLNKFPDTKVMMLTTFDDDEYVIDALRHGAVGYLLKNVSPEEVITSIRAVQEGAVQMSPEIARRHFNEVYELMEKGGVSHKFPAWYQDLTEKERRIVILVSKGKTNKEIGIDVHLADQTVRNYVSGIYQRLMINNRAELIRMVLEAGLSEEA